jgi:hypothetical protein
MGPFCLVLLSEVDHNLVTYGLRSRRRASCRLSGVTSARVRVNGPPLDGSDPQIDFWRTAALLVYP